MTEKHLQSAALTDTRVIVFSDLDGALLDHDGYSFEAAKPALAALAEQGIPVVATSSKTLAELEVLVPEMGLSAAAIAENGAVMKFADGTIDRAVSRSDIAAALNAVSPPSRAAMQCFCDMEIDEIAALTGLDHSSAERATMREASEPFLWRGDMAARRGELCENNACLACRTYMRCMTPRSCSWAARGDIRGLHARG